MSRTRLVAPFTLGLLTLGLAACGDKDTEASSSGTTTDGSEEADADTDADTDADPVNLLANAGFETYDGSALPTDWLLYPPELINWAVLATGDGMYPDAATFTAYEGTNSLKIYGQFTGWANETPVYQEFEATEGQQYMLEGYAFMYSNDAFDGTQSHASLWFKYFDDSYNFYGLEESNVIDAASTPDTWTALTVSGTVPAGATKVQAGMSFWHCVDEAEGDCYEAGGVYFDDLLFYEVTE